MKNEHPVPLRLLNTPLLVCEDEARRILAAAAGGLAAPPQNAGPEPRPGYSTIDRVAVIPISGGLTYKGYGWYWQTYRQIRRDFQGALSDPQVDAIVFDINSPGGEVAGCFDLVDAIYAARKTKPVYAVANEDCYSAAYAIASAAEKIYLPRTAGVGSIGVIAIHYEQSKWEANEGIKYTAIYAGRHKNDYSMHQPLSDEARQIAQAGVDRIHTLFCNTVARNRKLQPGQVREMEAAIFRGQDAVDAGLADAVMAWDEVMAQIRAASGSGHQTHATGGTMDKAEKLKTELAELLNDPHKRQDAEQMLSALGFARQDQAASDDRLSAARTEAERQGIEQGRNQALEVIRVCQAAGMPAMAADLIEKGVTAQEAGKIIVAARAAAETGINSSTAPVGGDVGNPLVEDARRRAGSAA